VTQKAAKILDILFGQELAFAFDCYGRKMVATNLFLGLFGSLLWSEVGL